MLKEQNELGRNSQRQVIWISRNAGYELYTLGLGNGIRNYRCRQSLNFDGG